MKFLVAEVVTAVRSRRGRRNLRVLTRFFLILAAMVVVYSIVFHLLMLREGREFSPFTGVYWTLTVMSTLGSSGVASVSVWSSATFVTVLVIVSPEVPASTVSFNVSVSLLALSTVPTVHTPVTLL